MKPKVKYFEATAGDKFYLVHRMDFLEYEHLKKKNL